MIRKAVLSLVVGLLLTLGSEATAQDYRSAVGLRFGTSNGLSVKHFLSEQAALEGILHTRWRGLLITGLYEFHQDLNDVPGLRWFYGGGAHIGTWNANRGNPRWGDRGEAHTVVGIDGIVGLDYKFDRAPVNLSLDYKPAFNISSDVGFWADELALSLRFTF